ncbi:MAG: putative integral membrane protein (TIGR00698 family) [Candidatus Pseudothioglobus sp.]
MVGLSHYHRNLVISNQLQQLQAYGGRIFAVLALPFLIYHGNPAVALLVGMSLTLLFDRPVVPQSSRYSKYLLQTAIVLLGLKLDMADMWRINADYTVFVAVYVLSAIAIGLLLGRLMGVENTSNAMIATGTGICGGTTIATLGPIIKASADQMGVALAIVFLLNAVALFTFPAIGEYFHLSQTQFGVWVALAIHDTSSVVATAALYGDQAASVATTVKLGRTLWLIPLVVVASLVAGRGGVKVRIPGFILLFILGSILGSMLPLPAALPGIAGMASKVLLVLALFLIGTEINRQTLRKLRGRVLAQALLLWMLVVPTTLLMVITLVS